MEEKGPKELAAPPQSAANYDELARQSPARHILPIFGLLLGGTIGGWIIGKLNQSILGLMLLCTLVLFISIRRLARFKEYFIFRIQRLSQKKKMDMHMETVEWLNTALEKFWLVLEPIISTQVVGTVNRILADNTPGFLDSIQLTEFTLGSSPPVIHNILTYSRTSPDTIHLDADISFVPNDLTEIDGRPAQAVLNHNRQSNSELVWNSKIVLKVRIGKGIVKMDIPVLLQEIALFGKIRVQADLMPTIPLLRQLKIAFHERPKIDFILKPLKSIDIMDLPGLSNFLFGLINNILDQHLVNPNMIMVNIAKGSRAQAAINAIGVAKIIIYQTRGLKWSGSAEPFVKVQLSGRTRGLTRGLQKKETAWNDVFYIPISSKKETLTIILYSEPGNSVGSIRCSLAELVELENSSSIWKSLLATSGQSKGELNFGLEFVEAEEPIITEQNTDKESTGKHDSELEGEDGEKLSVVSVGSISSSTINRKNTGLLTIAVTQACDLFGDDHNRVAHCFYQLWIHGRDRAHIQGKEQIPPDWDSNYYKSSTRKRTNNPNWDEPYELFIPRLSDAWLTILIRDGKEDDLILARWTGPIEPLIDTSDWIHCDNPDGAKFFARFSFKPVPIDVGDEGIKGFLVTPIGVARIKIGSGSGFRNSFGSAGYYYQVECNGRKIGRTRKAKDDVSPIWNQTIYAIIHASSDHISLTLRTTKELGKDAAISKFYLPLDEYFDHIGADMERSEIVADEKGRPTEGKLKLTVGLYSTILSEEQDEKLMASNQATNLPTITQQDSKSDQGSESSIPIIGATSTKSLLFIPEGLKKVTNSGILLINSINTRTVKVSSPKSRIYCEVWLQDEQPVCKTSISKLPPANSTNTWPQSTEIFVRGVETCSIWVEVREFKSRSIASDPLIGSFNIELTQLCSGEWYNLQAGQGVIHEYVKKGENFSIGQIMFQVKYIPVGLYLEEEKKEKGTLMVDIIKATNLRAADDTGTSDPYCLGRLNGGEKVFKTKMIKRTLSPEWKESFQVTLVNRQEASLLIEIKDWNRFGSSVLLGTLLVDLSTIKPDEWMDFVENLEGPVNGSESVFGKKGNCLEFGKIYFRLLYVPKGTKMATKSTAIVSGHQAPVKHVPIEAPFNVTAPIGEGFKKLGLGIGEVIGEAIGIRESEAKLIKASSHVDSTDLMLRIDINEASELLPLDSGGTSDPFCTIDLDDRTIFKTKVIKKTLSPEWFETFEMIIPKYGGDQLQRGICANNEKLIFEVKDWNRFQKSGNLGFAIVNLNGLPLNMPLEMDLALDGVKSGKLHVVISIIEAAPEPSTTSLSIKKQEDEMGGEPETDKESEKTIESEGEKEVESETEGEKEIGSETESEKEIESEMDKETKMETNDEKEIKVETKEEVPLILPTLAVAETNHTLDPHLNIGQMQPNSPKTKSDGIKEASESKNIIEARISSPVPQTISPTTGISLRLHKFSAVAPTKHESNTPFLFDCWIKVRMGNTTLYKSRSAATKPTTEHLFPSNSIVSIPPWGSKSEHTVRHSHNEQLSFVIKLVESGEKEDQVAEVVLDISTERPITTGLTRLPVNIDKQEFILHLEILGPFSEPTKKKGSSLSFFGLKR